MSNLGKPLIYTFRPWELWLVLSLAVVMGIVVGFIITPTAM
jgi:uncharacterized membrane-anchored protein YhcB (DUF1043 family)